jgi:hypothetical protein
VTLAGSERQPAYEQRDNCEAEQGNNAGDQQEIDSFHVPIRGIVQRCYIGTDRLCK